VLDTSAVLAYGRGDAVGETLREVHLNEAAFTVPVGCLAAAGRKVEPHVVELLLNHVAFEPWSTPLAKMATGWMSLATIANWARSNFVTHHAPGWPTKRCVVCHKIRSCPIGDRCGYGAAGGGVDPLTAKQCAELLVCGQGGRTDVAIRLDARGPTKPSGARSLG
jgi:hypothetical protein